MGSQRVRHDWATNSFTFTFWYDLGQPHQVKSIHVFVVKCVKAQTERNKDSKDSWFRFCYQMNFAVKWVFLDLEVFWSLKLVSHRVGHKILSPLPRWGYNRLWLQAQLCSPPHLPPVSLFLFLSLSPPDEPGCHVMRCLVEMLSWQETEGNHCPTAHAALTLWPTRSWVLPAIPWTSLNPILPCRALRWPQPVRDPDPEDPDRLHPGSWPPEAGRSQMVF